MLSVGIDMVEIERIKRAMRNQRFLERILGGEEYAQLSERGFSTQSIAANFCAKEAFSKSVGTGFRGFGMKDVQIIRDTFGCPFIKLNDLVINTLKYNFDFSLSVTHTKNYASAVVICTGGEGKKHGV